MILVPLPFTFIMIKWNGVNTTYRVEVGDGFLWPSTLASQILFTMSLPAEAITFTSSELHQYEDTHTQLNDTDSTVQTGNTLMLHVTLPADSVLHQSCDMSSVHHVPKKVSHLMFDNNFGKCGPIFKIHSPGDL